MANGSMPNVVHAGPKYTHNLSKVSHVDPPSPLVERGWGTRIEIQQKCDRQKNDSESKNEDEVEHYVRKDTNSYNSFFFFPLDVLEVRSGKNRTEGKP